MYPISLRKERLAIVVCGMVMMVEEGYAGWSVLLNGNRAGDMSWSDCEAPTAALGIGG